MPWLRLDDATAPATSWALLEVLVPLRIAQQPGTPPSSLNDRTAEARHARALCVPRSLRVSGRPLVPKQCLCATWPRRPQHRARVSTALMAQGRGTQGTTPASQQQCPRLAAGGAPSVLPLWSGAGLRGTAASGGQAGSWPGPAPCFTPEPGSRAGGSVSPASPAAHAGNACSQPACRCAASSRARLQGAHGPRRSNMQEGSSFTRDTDQRPRQARAALPTAPGLLSRSPGASEDPWGGWHRAEVGTGRGEATPAVFSTPETAPACWGLRVVYTDLSSAGLSRWGQGPWRASGAIPP